MRGRQSGSFTEVESSSEECGTQGRLGGVVLDREGSVDLCETASAAGSGAVAGAQCRREGTAVPSRGLLALPSLLCLSLKGFEHQSDII